MTALENIDFLATKGAIVGCNYSGIVEEVGPAVTNDLKIGDRVAGFVHGRGRHPGRWHHHSRPGTLPIPRPSLAHHPHNRTLFLNPHLRWQHRNRHRRHPVR